MKLKRIIFTLVLAGPGVFVLAEALLRWPGHPEVVFKLADKRLHCLDPDGFRIRLCPDVSIAFEHPFGFDYRITTDARGERIVYATTPDAGDARPEVWIIGDSIAMGYGQSDADTFAALIGAARGDLRVRNLGIDALGAAGILSVLEGALEDARANGRPRPVRVFWIMHMSDFIDDVHDLHLAASGRARLIRRFHFFMSSWSATYNFARHVAEQWALSRKRNVYTAEDTAPEPPPLDHPTFGNIDRALTLAREQGLDLYFVFYPNVDHATGRTGQDYTLENILKEFIGERDGRIIDTRPAFMASGRDDLYLPTDGHPAPAAARIFADEILKAMPE